MKNTKELIDKARAHRDGENPMTPHAVWNMACALEESERERDGLFARLADLSWEKMSPREQAVWAAAFAYVNTWDGDSQKSKAMADAAVVELRMVLK